LQLLEVYIYYKNV